MNACQLIKQFGPLAGRTMLALIFLILKNVCILGGLLYVMAYGSGPLSLEHDDC